MTEAEAIMTGNERKTNPGGEDLLELLGRQVNTYGELQTLADKQRMLVKAEDTAPLMTLLAERQRLTQELQQLGERMAPWRQNWATWRETLRPQQRASAEGMIREVNDRLRRLLASDEQDMRMLSLRRQRVGQLISEARCGRAALTGYRDEAAASPGHFEHMDSEA